MTPESLNTIRNAVRERRPLIHCITNPISINQCANAVLAVGASPMMAEHPREVGEITPTAQALVLNLGNITDARMESMTISANIARENHIPFLVDAVGTACSSLRRTFACELMEKTHPTVIKGNYSEINALYRTSYSSVGVDADDALDTATVTKAAVELAREYNTVILASGKTDIVTDGNKVFHIKNGTLQLAAVTGTGCMLGVLCGCYLAVCPEIAAAVTACAVLGICGELAETVGSGSFMVNLMDRLSTLTEEELAVRLNLETVAKHTNSTAVGYKNNWQYTQPMIGRGHCPLEEPEIEKI